MQSLNRRRWLNGSSGIMYSLGIGVLLIRYFGAEETSKGRGEMFRPFLIHISIRNR
jgi:hypothetical protein